MLSGNYVDLTVWSVAECSVALISAHIPSLQFLFTQFVKKMKLPTTPINGRQLDSDETDLVTERGIARQDGASQRLYFERPTFGFNETPDQYGWSVYAKKYGLSDEEVELEHSNTTAHRIYVSKTIDICSSQSDKDSRPGVERM